MKKFIAVMSVLLSAAMLASCGKYSEGDKLLQQAVSEYKEQDYAAALEVLSLAEEEELKNSSEEDLHFYLGETYYKMGEYEKSIEEHKKAIEINPDTFKSYVTIGVCYRKLGDKKEALNYYLTALLYDPKNADSVGLYISLGAHYIENNKPYSAADYLEKAAAIYPEHPAAHAYLAIAYTMQYEYEQSDNELALAESYGYDKIEEITDRINTIKDGQNNG